MIVIIMEKRLKMINCKQIAADRKELIKKRVDAMNIKPSLAVIQVGDDAASNAYIKGKKADCEDVGINIEHYRFEEDGDEVDILYLIDRLNNDKSIHGIIVQLPLPKSMNKKKILDAIADEKDVDGFKHNSKFTPCTPLGVLSILDTIGANVDGKICCVVGRGEVGKPMVDLLTQNNATVIWCNSHTNEYTLSQLIGISDIIISATGKAGLIKDVPYGKTVIDVGITRGEDGKLHGDVDASNYSDNALITPVPGGVGLMTRVSLLENVVYAAELMSKPS